MHSIKIVGDTLIATSICLVFPPLCDKFLGPHELACLESIWRDAGCLDSGQSSPSNFTEFQLQYAQASTIKYVISDVLGEIDRI